MRAAGGSASSLKDDDAPLLPAATDDQALRTAIGASPEPSKTQSRSERHHDDDDDLPVRPRNRKAVATLAIAAIAGLAIAAIIFVGRANSERYSLICEAERAVPEQGRSFPPWGARPLDGEAWKPLKITAETRCQPHEVDDELALGRLYLAMLLDQAAAQLTARDAAKLDDVDALLQQALLLTRPPAQESPAAAKDRNDRHADVERLLGDVAYGRAQAKLRDATSALGDAAKQFDSANALHPRHTSDAAAWASYARKLADQLRAGPTGATAAGSASAPAASTTAPAAATEATPTAAIEAAPAGSAATAATAEPAAGSAASAPSAGSAASAPSAPAHTGPPPVDAGVPATGGVLL